MLDGIVDVCDANGLELVFHNSRKDRQLPSDPYAGYLLWGFEWKSVSVIERWKQSNYNMVTLHNYFPHLDIPYVNSDNYTGGYLATQHLLSLGHKRIGIILLARSPSNYDLFPEFALRLQGFNLAMSNNGIASDSSLVFADNYDKLDLEDLGYRGMKHLMEQTHPPTAVFATADFAAIGALKAVEDLRLTVPDDVSIVGYDGYSISKYTKPALTTVDQNFYDLGKAGIEKLLNGSADFEESRVRPQLIIRASTKEPSTRRFLG
jgi:DNA-binding LacI/PurR family transcriptional regulator